MSKNNLFYKKMHFVINKTNNLHEIILNLNNKWGGWIFKLNYKEQNEVFYSKYNSHEN